MQPNHICKNANCTKGEDGTRCHYFACDICDKKLTWRSMACCKECYDEYMNQISMSRQSRNLYPERTDMTHGEVVNLVVNENFNTIKTKTMNELAAYSEEIETNGLECVIDKINNDIAIKKPRNSRTKKTK